MKYEITKKELREFERLVRDRINDLQDKDQESEAKTWWPLLKKLGKLKEIK